MALETFSEIVIFSLTLRTHNVHTVYAMKNAKQRNETDTNRLQPKAPQLLDTRQVAERLGLKPATIYQMCASGELPSVRIGKRALRVSEPELIAYIERNSVGSAA